jgi:hypothetical protein
MLNLQTVNGLRTTVGGQHAEYAAARPSAAQWVQWKAR